MTTRTFDIRQLIAKVDPNNAKRQTLTYDWSNNRRFYKNELPGQAVDDGGGGGPPTGGLDSGFSTGFSTGFN